MLLPGHLFGLLFNPKDGGDTFLQNVGEVSDRKVSHPTIYCSITINATITQVQGEHSSIVG
jgi:hypothetical protein